MTEDNLVKMKEISIFLNWVFTCKTEDMICLEFREVIREGWKSYPYNLDPDYRFDSLAVIENTDKLWDLFSELEVTDETLISHMTFRDSEIVKDEVDFDLSLMDLTYLTYLTRKYWSMSKAEVVFCSPEELKRLNLSARFFLSLLYVDRSMLLYLINLFKNEK